MQVPGDGSLQKMIMIFGVVLAGGIGSRMGNVDKPKQYLLVGEKPIIIHTLERFYVQNEFEKIIVLCPEEWVSHTKNLIKKYMKDTDRIVVLRGGDTRNETIMNSLRYIEKEYGLDDDTIVVTHDSVRPFVTQRIIEENIKYAKEYGACDTAVAATDTIVYSQDNVLISDIPDRSKMYQGQTPQTFNALKLKNLYESLTEEEKAEEKSNILNGLNFARKVVVTQECDFLLLDEILGLVDLGIITCEDVIRLIDMKDESVELIMTGRHLPEELIPYADYISRLDIVKGACSEKPSCM